jgi:pyruvate dehydrogenase E1 component
MAEMREQQHFVASGDQPIITDGLPAQYPDIDEVETREWLESFDAVVDEHGRSRGRFLLLKVLERARQRNIGIPSLTTTDYINTIPPEREPRFPGDEQLERRIRRYIRWNAAVMVHRTNVERGTGGHIGSYASSASLYEVGFNHFFRARTIPVAATRSTSRVTPPRASTPARSSRAGWTRRGSTASVPRSNQVGCRATRTRG